MPTYSNGSELVHGSKTRAQAQYVYADEAEIRGQAEGISISSDQRRLEGPTGAQGPHEQDLCKESRDYSHSQQPLGYPIDPRHDHLTRAAEEGE
jgi:hypothetical protein